ncbi:hypothetical protein NX801_13835 [Streptomyces sp. LP05-1]|uniref:Secreted protein n=1 Tax=Streptomyces pyxinae TaxID=2970734 RepID=A0ABT2CJ36_9ACTN|nr:hypothetical protein [Streptomyces sp. LP05-1]MCS0636721.1 hypothetical protein [Streptomyces sp. LP05-1]
MTGSPVVPALGLAAVAAAGCVWYVPSLADLRAGADRPASRRLAATGCLTGWSSVALLVPLLLLAPGWAALGTAVAGAAATVVLRLRAVAVRRREEWEAAVDWAALRLPGPLPGDGRGRTGSPGRVAAWLGLAPAAAVVLVLGAAALGAGPPALLLGPVVPVVAVVVLVARAAGRPRGGPAAVPAIPAQRTRGGRTSGRPGGAART